jgi:hypothetical protein
MPVEATSHRRRWLRYSLRSLIIVVTAGAVLSWAYFFGWPWFWAYYEQVRFERAASQLKAGDSTFSVMGAFTAAGLLAPKKMAPTSYTSTESQTLFGLSQFVLTNAVYFVYLGYPKDYSGGLLSAPSVRVEVFRLPQVPRDYKAQRKVVDKGYGNRTEPPKPGEAPEKTYADDFEDFIKSDRRDFNGLHFELLHSDPSLAPLSKAD